MNLFWTLFLIIIGIYFFCAFCISLQDFNNAGENDISKNILLSLLWAFFATIFIPFLIIFTPILWIYKIKENNLLHNLYEGFKGLSKKYTEKIRHSNMFKGFTKEEIAEWIRRHKKYGYQNNKNGWRKVSDEEMEDILKWQNRRK